MSKSAHQHNIRTVLPADGDPFKDRIEFFMQSGGMTADTAHVNKGPQLSKNDEDFSGPPVEHEWSMALVWSLR
jgi:hypothetical protein